MFCEVFSTMIQGITAHIVSVETDVGRGLPVFDMGGYLSGEVKEAKERVRVALRNSGYEWKPQRITINISPADLRKDGTGFDLPIALGILGANGEINPAVFQDMIAIGELSLDGTVNPVNGILPSVSEAAENGFKRCILPRENYMEGKVVEGIEVIAVHSIKEAVDYLNDGVMPAEPQTVQIPSFSSYDEELDFADIRGQETAKRATMIAVAGMHNILYVGSPGSGKTMLARRIPSIMPTMTLEERLNLTKIYSIAGLINQKAPLITKRPFRCPNHNITTTALLGGGRIPMPGEATLSGKGVMFLDELTEYKPAVLESLRQPLEDKKVVIVRLKETCVYPADFMLAAAMNPCRCGYYPDRNRCSCTEQDIRRFLGKISRPLWDRFDVCIQVNDVGFNQIRSTRMDSQWTSEYMRQKVEKARIRQLQRFSKSGIYFNAQMNSRQIQEFCILGSKEQELMDKIYDKFHLTARGYHKILKTARTIADIEEQEQITAEHLSEALSYRSYQSVIGERI